MVICIAACKSYASNVRKQMAFCWGARHWRTARAKWVQYMSSDYAAQNVQWWGEVEIAKCDVYFLLPSPPLTFFTLHTYKFTHIIFLHTYLICFSTGSLYHSDSGWKNLGQLNINRRKCVCLGMSWRSEFSNLFSFVAQREG